KIYNQLSFEFNLNGTKAYGPVDYLVKFGDVAMLINEAKLDDIPKGIAQNIMQLHSASEASVSLAKTEFGSEPLLFEIVSTGSIWHFIRWIGSPEKPNVDISRRFICNFEGDMQNENCSFSYYSYVRGTKRCIE
ncbi:4423_t:CDS:2, partial [Funneliformis mosseae]